ncbi:MAG: guanylate kinase [Lachnospiraceae bacterium]
MENKGILAVMSGFSGAGKGTVVKRLLSDYDCYWVSISMTTRQPRPGEVDGISYHFVSRETFEEMIANDGFLEYAEYQGNYYGTPKAPALEHLAAGEDVILEIETVGAFKVREVFPEALLFYVVAPSAEELKRRLEGRGTETEEQILGRLKKAAKEAEVVDRYDYILINDVLDEAVTACHSLIQREKTRASKSLPLINRLKNELEEITK